jgi:hypothetical protein
MRGKEGEKEEEGEPLEGPKLVPPLEVVNFNSS